MSGTEGSSMVTVWGAQQHVRSIVLDIFAELYDEPLALERHYEEKQQEGHQGVNYEDHALQMLRYELVTLNMLNRVWLTLMNRLGARSINEEQIKKR